MAIEDLINQNVRFEGRSRDWQHCKCKLCNDYKVRASFSVEDARIKYNCFNCGVSTSYTKNSTYLHKDFRDVLNAYGIDDTDIDLELGKTYFTKEQIVIAKKKAESKIAEVALPPNSYQVTTPSEDDMWTIVADEYLQSRGLSLADHTWFLSTHKDYRDRIIIPYYKDGKVIYWDARSFDDNAKKRYINPTTPKEPILFGYDELERNFDKPLFIMEGAFDAISISGVGMGGSKLYKQKIEAFKKCRRRKIFVIDKKDKQNNGYKLGLDALNHDWEITFTTGDGLDVNKSVAKYGKIWTIRDLLENAKSGLEARVSLEVSCKNHSVK
jgi:DNA primase